METVLKLDPNHQIVVDYKLLQLLKLTTSKDTSNFKEANDKATKILVLCETKDPQIFKLSDIYFYKAVFAMFSDDSDGAIQCLELSLKEKESEEQNQR